MTIKHQTMYSSAKVFLIFLDYVFVQRNIISNIIYVFNEDEQDFQNIHGKYWEYRKFEPSESSNLTLAVSTDRFGLLDSSLKLF